jgi:hypothetical protein
MEVTQVIITCVFYDYKFVLPIRYAMGPGLVGVGRIRIMLLTSFEEFLTGLSSRQPLGFRGWQC